MKSRQATQDDVSRIIQSLQIRDQRILEAEAALKRMQEKYDKLREELLPVFKMAKERYVLLVHVVRLTPIVSFRTRCSLVVTD